MNKIKKDSKIPQVVFFICAIFAGIMLLLITIFIFSQSIPAIKEVGLWNMLSGTEWRPTADAPSYGILPMILSSFAATFGAIIIGVPLGVLTAVFISKIAPKFFVKLITPMIDLLAGIPSVIFGFMGLTIVLPLVAHVFNIAYGGTLLTAILILSIMILPTIVSITVNSLNSVPSTYEEASLALGANKIQTIFKILIPAAKSGILSGVILGIGRAIGETMAVILVSGNTVNMPELLGPVRLLTSGIVSEMSYADAFHRQVLFAIGLVLFVFIMIINIILNVVVKNSAKKYS